MFRCASLILTFALLALLLTRCDHPGKDVQPHGTGPESLSLAPL